MNNMFCCQDTRTNRKSYPLTIYNEFSMRDPKTKEIITEIVPFDENRSYQKYWGWSRVKVLSRNYKELFRELKEQETHFIDIEFPHTNEAIIQEPDQKKIMWKRIPDIVDDCVYSKEYSTKSLEKFKSSNKDLQNALVLIARSHPQKFKQLLSKTLNDYGIYEFRLYKDGIIENVVIDDYVPVYQNQPIFTGPIRQKEVYAMLLEKAIAKLYGCYDLIPRDCEQLMETIFCGAVRKKDFEMLETREQIFLILDQGLLKNGLVILLSKMEPKVRNYGITENELYHIIDSHTVQIKGSSVKLYECLTESRINAWNGKFSLNDEIWREIDPEAKFKVFNQMKKNRSFCICEQDISRIFQELMIFQDTSTSNKDWIESNSETDVPAFIKFTLRESDRVFVRAVSPHRIRQSLILSRIHEGNEIQYIGGSIETSEKSVEFSKRLQPGEYVICSLQEWLFEKAGEYRMFLSSNTHTNLQRVGNFTIPNYFENMFFNHSIYSEKESKESHLHQLYSYKLLVYEIGLAYLHIRTENSTKNGLKVLIDQKKLQEEQWSILQPYTGVRNVTIAKIPNKNNDKIFVLKAQDYRIDKKVIFPSIAFTIQQ